MSGTEFKSVDKECELAKFHNFQNNLSVITLKGGESLILKNNCEILLPKKEWENILNIAHANTHRGYDGMIQQMRGKVWWEGMNKDAKEKVRTCDPCQRFARSHSQDTVEISHSNMFNLFPGHTLHLDFCEFNGKDYILIVDRMTGYIGAEQTVNQGTEAAISAVKNWSTKFGYPYRIISDSGGAFRKNI